MLVIDGAAFPDFVGFAGEFSGLLDNYRWRGNLDAFNDVLRGGFGIPEGLWTLRWLNSDLSRSALGYILRVAPAEVDASIFGDLVERGRRRRGGRAAGREP